MREYDRSCERNWYRVHIDLIATFIVRSYTEDSAMLKVDYYCQSVPGLGLNIEEEGSLPLMTEWAKPLGVSEREYYESLGDDINPVRLIEDKRRIPVIRPKERQQGSRYKQLGLFTINDAGIIGYSKGKY